MDLSKPFEVITPTLDGKVLEVLARTDTEFTTGEIHRILAGPSVRGIANVLGRLSDQGLVLRKPAGWAWLYRLNRQHLAAAHVIGISQIRATLIDRLASEFSSWPQAPVLGALFGSATTGNHSKSSDIDLFIVRPDNLDEKTWEDQVESVTAKIVEWTGNDTRVLILTKSQVENQGLHEPVLQDILLTSVLLFGDRDWLARSIRNPEIRP